jgi:adenosylcobinamide kinase/adenosylcobinamide-phosphate guanylyltransferase
VLQEDGAGKVIVVDCLTLWLSNLMLREQDVVAATSTLLEALARRRGTVLLVSNEVGMGIVPENALARRFRDEAGRLNQAIARAADEVVLVSAGLGLRMK